MEMNRPKEVFCWWAVSWETKRFFCTSHAVSYLGGPCQRGTALTKNVNSVLLWGGKASFHPHCFWLELGGPMRQERPLLHGGSALLYQ